MSLLSDAVFSLAGRGSAAVAGRQAIAITARPRRQWHERTDPQLWDGPDEYRLLVDAERGILLSVTGYFQGRAMAGAEMQQIQFHDPLPPRSGRWQRIGELVNLLYGAQYNFATVQVAVSEWGYADKSDYRLWAANPDCFRTEHPVGDDGSCAVTAFRGVARWRYSPRRRQAQTNAAVESLPHGISAEFYLEPDDPGLEVYEIRDGEYAIAAEWTLNPSPLLYALWLEPLGRTTFAGREAIRVRGEPNPASGYRWWHEHAAAFELLVDAQRGTLLRFAVIENGAEAFRQEVTDIEFDAPIPDAMFSFDRRRKRRCRWHCPAHRLTALSPLSRPVTLRLAVINAFVKVIDIGQIDIGQVIGQVVAVARRPLRRQRVVDAGQREAHPDRSIRALGAGVQRVLYGLPRQAGVDGFALKEFAFHRVVIFLRKGHLAESPLCCGHWVTSCGPIVGRRLRG